MKSCPRSFNLYFTLICLALAGGCASETDAQKEHKKEQSTIRLYLEDRAPASSGTVLVTRQKIPMSVEREPFLTEEDLSRVSLISEADGTYSIQLLFNDHGALVLEMYTTAHKGKHIVVFAQFPKPGTKQAKAKKKKDDDNDDDANFPESVPPTNPNKPRESAWMSAVLIRDRISNGLFRFTPDISHAEGVRIVRGLKNVIAKANKLNK